MRMIVCVKRNHMAVSTFIMFGIKNVKRTVVRMIVCKEESHGC